MAVNDTSLTQQMQDGYSADEWFSDPNNTADLEFRDGLWWHGEQVVVPDATGLRRGIMYEMHDAPYSGHPGVSKTAKSVQRWFWWPSLFKDVKHYVLTCASCQRHKASNQKPAGLMQPLPVPQAPWESVSMDFITGLPPSESANSPPGGYNAILVFVDRLSKMTHLAPTTERVTAEETAQLFMEQVFKHHGAPKSVVTDRGSVFTGTFMTAVLQAIGTRHGRSTAFHPQSDGQTERVNRTLEDMLRHYVDQLGHSSWATCLPTAEFAINNAYHDSIGTTPFRLNKGYDPPLPLSIPNSKVPKANDWVQGMQQALVDARRCMQAAQQRQKQYYDEGRRDVRFSVGEEVLVNAKNIKLRRTGDKSSCRKFLPKYVGPFRVKAIVGKGLAYELGLPKGWRIHPVFHVSLLKPYKRDPNQERVQPPVARQPPAARHQRLLSVRTGLNSLLTGS